MLEFEFFDENDKVIRSRRSNSKPIELPTEFEFEFVDESEIEFARRGRNSIEKIEKTPCMLDQCKLENRTYWGNPESNYVNDNDGYILLVLIVETKIYRSIQKHLIIELDDVLEYRMLKKEDRDYFAKLQNELLHEKHREWLEQNKG